MKKVYSKITMERKKEFQIETSIVVKDNKKYVYKSPVSLESREHIQKMSNFYNEFKENEKIHLCPCKREGYDVIFEYVKGESFYEKILKACNDKDKKIFFEYLKEYREIVEKLANLREVKNFVEDEEFKKIFKESNGLDGKKSAYFLNLDLSFDNIICNNESYTIIDYEWIFKGLIPIDFVIFRSIYAFLIKNSEEIKKVSNKDDIYKFFGISKYDITVYERLNSYFNEYVFGKEGYQSILKKYEKTNTYYSLSKKDKDFYQVFINKGNGFLEKDSNIYPYLDKEKYSIFIELDKNSKEIRFDPFYKKGIIKIENISLIKDGLKKEVTEFDHNAIFSLGKLYIFNSEDPSIIFKIEKEYDFLQIEFIVLKKTYDVVLAIAEILDYNKNENIKILKELNNTETNLNVFSEKDISKKISLEIKKLYDDKIVMMEILEKQSEELDYLRKQKLKLEYIKGTKAYNLLVKNKVNKIFYEE